MKEKKRQLKLKFKRAAKRKKTLEGSGDMEEVDVSGLDLNSQGSLALDSRDANDFFMINGGSELDGMESFL